VDDNSSDSLADSSLIDSPCSPCPKKLNHRNILFARHHFPVNSDYSDCRKEEFSSPIKSLKLSSGKGASERREQDFKISVVQQEFLKSEDAISLEHKKCGA